MSDLKPEGKRVTISPVVSPMQGRRYQPQSPVFPQDDQVTQKLFLFSIFQEDLRMRRAYDNRRKSSEMPQEQPKSVPKTVSVEKINIFTVS
jgi:hypothetical protein